MREARSGAPWVRKFGKLSIRENLVMMSPYVRPYVRPYGLSGWWKLVRTDFWGRGKRSFLREITWRNVAQLYYHATGFQKEISKQLSKKIFRQSLTVSLFITSYESYCVNKQEQRDFSV